MIITITESGEYIMHSGKEPVVGRSYALEDATTGSGAQNKAFHALIQEYWRSGAHSYQAESFDVFRNMIKKNLGAGFEAFVYVELIDGRPVIKDAATYEEIPEHIRRDPELRNLARGRLKSWSEYTKKERMETLDRLIAEMHQAGVQSDKFQTILDGMSA